MANNTFFVGYTIFLLAHLSDDHMKELMDNRLLQQVGGHVYRCGRKEPNRSLHVLPPYIRCGCWSPPRLLTRVTEIGVAENLDGDIPVAEAKSDGPLLDESLDPVSSLVEIFIVDCLAP